MNNNGIRRKILEILYEAAKEHGGNFVERDYLKNQLKLDDDEIDFEVRYLHEKAYLDISPVSDVYFLAAKITSHGMDLVEDNATFNSVFPINITHTTVQNSPGTVINSHNVSINIQDSFNKIYEQIPIKNPDNSDEVKEKIEELEKELEKDEINKSKIQKSYDWLKRNASWTIPSIVQIMTATLIGS